jgi:segregation and condensation protein B
MGNPFQQWAPAFWTHGGQPGRQGRQGRQRLPHNHRLPAIYRLLVESAAEAQARARAQPAGEFARSSRLAQLEAALFLADEPLNTRRLAQAAGLTDAAEARQLIRQLQELYEREGSAFQLEELAGGFQLLTRPEYYPWLVRLRRASSELKLTAAARETLAIIAYRQPIMRADVESIRGVQCSDVLKQLMEKNLIRIAGRDDSLGRPVLYGTTRKFLQLLGLRSLRDLPRAGEFKRPDRESSGTDPPEEKE